MSTPPQTTSPAGRPPSKPPSSDTKKDKGSRTSTPLNELLASFNATWLGEGDINAGTNLLVAEVITLSNLCRTGCGIQLTELNRMKAGCSLFVGGALSSSFISEMRGEVAILQNNLTAHLCRFVGDKIADAQKKGLKLMEFPSGPGANAAENALFQLEQKDSIYLLDQQEEWSKVLNSPPSPRIEEIAARPKLVVTAKGPKDLEKQLHGLHGHRPLVCLSLNGRAEASAYADTCNALLNGPYPVGDFGETVSAHLLVTDPGNVLAQVAPTGGEEVGWLGRMVWLVDSTRGPYAAESSSAPGKFSVSDTGARFGKALTAVLTKRLNNRDAGTVVHPFDLAKAQISWAAYLKGMEGRLPGITGTARGLLATLAFGLTELAEAPNCDPLPVTPEGVEALGRWVIQRMANARVAMLRTDEVERMRHLALRLLLKLGDGKFSKRDLCRTFTIPAARCEKVLFALEPAGLVRQVDGSWERIHPGPFLDTEIEALFN